MLPLWIAVALACVIPAGCRSMVEVPAAVAMPARMSTPPVDAWPGWRGGLHQGAAASMGVPTRWLSEDARWRVSVPGRGNSSPIVWGEDVFLTTEDGNQLLLLCYDRRDGSQRWAAVLGEPSGETHGRNGHASATPATDGNLVVAAAGGALHAVDFDGRVIWRRPLLGGGHRWGAASSPVLCGDLVIQLDDNEDGNSRIAAYELTTGELRWQTPRHSSGCWTTPVVACDQAGRPQTVFVNGSNSDSGEAGEVTAYSARDGRVLWSVAATADLPCPTALLTEQLVISSTGSNGPLTALRRDSGLVEWRLPAGGAQVPTGVYVNSLLFLLSDHGGLSCIDLEGNLLWRQRLPGRYSASLIAAGDHLYACNESGDVYVTPATRELTAAAPSPLDEGCTATPAVAGDQLLFRTESQLICIGPAMTVAKKQSSLDTAVIENVSIENVSIENVSIENVSYEHVSVQPGTAEGSPGGPR